MSVADCFGLDDPESPLMSEAREGWGRWCVDELRLAVVDDLLDLRSWTCAAASSDKDRVLAHLAELARDEHAAGVALVWLLLPGATALADRLRDLSPEIDALVAGQLWIEGLPQPPVAASRRGEGDPQLHAPTGPGRAGRRLSREVARQGVE